MKVSASIKLRCNKCQFVRRGTKKIPGRLLVICEDKKHKQRQG